MALRISTVFSSKSSTIFCNCVALRKNLTKQKTRILKTKKNKVFYIVFFLGTFCVQEILCCILIEHTHRILDLNIEMCNNCVDCVLFIRDDFTCFKQNVQLEESMKMKATNRTRFGSHKYCYL